MCAFPYLLWVCTLSSPIWVSHSEMHLLHLQPWATDDETAREKMMKSLWPSHKSSFFPYCGDKFFKKRQNIQCTIWTHDTNYIEIIKTMVRKESNLICWKEHRLSSLVRYRSKSHFLFDKTSDSSLTRNVIEIKYILGKHSEINCWIWIATRVKIRLITNEEFILKWLSCLGLLYILMSSNF